jgi:nitric oxide reductase activation protein
MMDEVTFQQKLSELVKEIGTLPASQRKKLELLAQETKQRHIELRKSVTNLQESLDYLRLSIKYLLFDLEATRRENSYLRQLLEDSDKQQ